MDVNEAVEACKFFGFENRDPETLKKVFNREKEHAIKHGYEDTVSDEDLWYEVIFMLNPDPNHL